MSSFMGFSSSAKAKAAPAASGFWPLAYARIRAGGGGVWGGGGFGYLSKMPPTFWINFGYHPKTRAVERFYISKLPDLHFG